MNRYRLHRGLPITLAGVGLILALFAGPEFYILGALMFLGAFLLGGMEATDNKKPSPVWVRRDRKRYRA